MKLPIEPRTFSRLQLLAFLAVFAGTLALPWLAIEHADWAFVVRHRPDAFWITAPQPASRAKAIPIDRTRPRTHHFSRSFRLAAPPEQVDLNVRALSRWTLWVNGEPVEPAVRPESWKRAARLDLSGRLRRGENRIELAVEHPEGPALLQTWSEALPGPLGTGGDWLLTLEDRKMAAEVAHDVRVYQPGARLPQPMPALGERAGAFFLVFLLFAALPLLPRAAPGLAASPALAALGGANAPRTALAVVGLVWLGLFVRKALELPLMVGFDAEAHVAYVQLLATEWRVPTAAEGWEMFHPPLYHALGAALRGLFSSESGSPLDRALLRVVPLLAGLAGAWLAGRTAARLWPGRAGVAAVATLAAGLLPMNLYISTFVSNESLHAAWVGAGLFLACDQLVAPRASRERLAALSILLGLALVTKSTTSLPVASVVIAALGTKLWLVEGRPLPRALGVAAALGTGPLLLAGWFYARNYLLFGDPFVSNLDALGDLTYWVPPGFHTPPWLSGFGEVFTRPFFASFHSYWDGFYSSFWGDGYASGRAGVAYPNPWWDYDAMAAVYPLAVPATLLLVLGFGVSIVEAFRGADLGRRLALSLLVVTATGMMLMLYLTTLRIPINAMPKAFYTLPALVPFAVFFAAGCGWLWERLPAPAARSLLAGYGGTLGVAIALAFLR